MKLPSRIRALTPNSRTEPNSPGARAGNVVYVSGTLAIDKDGRTVGVRDVKAQTRFVLETVKSVVEAAGGSPP